MSKDQSNWTLAIQIILIALGLRDVRNTGKVVLYKLKELYEKIKSGLEEPKIALVIAAMCKRRLIIEEYAKYSRDQDTSKPLYDEL